MLTFDSIFANFYNLLPLQEITPLILNTVVFWLLYCELETSLWTHDVNWTYIRRSEVLSTFKLRPVSTGMYLRACLMFFEKQSWNFLENSKTYDEICLTTIFKVNDKDDKTASLTFCLFRLLDFDLQSQQRYDVSCEQN